MTTRTTHAARLAGAAASHADAPKRRKAPVAHCLTCGAVVGRARRTCAPCDLVAALEAARLPAPVRELRFWPARKWRADLAYPQANLLIEADGGQHMAGGGRHNTDADREKLNHAAVAGWRVLRFSTQQLDRDMTACVEVIRKALEARP